MTFSVLSTTSLKILGLLENLEIDAGLTYLENEPLGRVTSVPLQVERYHLVTAAGTELSDRESVTWKEVGGIRLCLLTADMQNRRIINQHFAEAGVTVYADARIELDDRAFLPCAHRPLGQHHAL